MRILLATDGSRHSRSAMDLLKRTQFASPGNEVRVLVSATRLYIPSSACPSLFFGV